MFRYVEQKNLKALMISCVLTILVLLNYPACVRVPFTCYFEGSEDETIFFLHITRMKSGGIATPPNRPAAALLPSTFSFTPAIDYSAGS